MHVAFIPYGERSHVEKFLQCMECQSFKLPITKGKDKRTQWIFGGLRKTPLCYEYVFPKEYEQVVLKTLRFDQKTPYKMGVRSWAVRKSLKYKKAPKVKTDQKFIWKDEHVAIIPIGVRYDKDLTYDTGALKGFTHEAL